MNDEGWMRIALTEAHAAAQAGEIPVGAVLVRDGQEVCRAHNLRETQHDPTAHAEILCMRMGAEKLGTWRLRGCTLYVTLEPCPMCAGAMVMSQLSACVYGANDDRQGCCGSVYDLPGDAALSGVTVWHSGVLAQECQAVLTTFFAEKRASSALR